MCFRPSAFSQKDNAQKFNCSTCGMPIEFEDKTCPYCGDPILQESPDDFSEIDPSYSTRVI